MEVPNVIETAMDIASGDIKRELLGKTSQNSFVCSICWTNYTDLKCFYYHLESHYLPQSPEHFECSVCQESEEIFKAQVDFYIHVREHFKPSLIAELGTSITGIVLIRNKVQTNLQGSIFLHLKKEKKSRCMIWSKADQ